jgi:hypothetical protein
MESLALTVAILLLASILLAGTAVLFAVLYARGRVRFRTAMIWVVLAAIDIGFMAATGQVRAYILQALMLATAVVIVLVARRSRELK